MSSLPHRFLPASRPQEEDFVETSDEEDEGENGDFSKDKMIKKPKAKAAAGKGKAAEKPKAVPKAKAKAKK